MISIVPGYISRSVAGSYDNEGIAIFCMLFTYYLWIKSVKTGQIYWSALCSVAYFYMVSSWGGYVFLINLIPMHVFTLIICGRFTHRHYIAYSTVYCIGTLLSMQISFVGFQPVQTSEHMLVSFCYNTLWKLQCLTFSHANSRKIMPHSEPLFSRLAKAMNKQKNICTLGSM